MADAGNITDRRFAPAMRLGEVLAAVRQSYARHRVFIRTRRELQALTTAELDDLGLSRSMITRLAAEAAYGKGD